METTVHNTKRQTTEKELITLKAIKKLLQANDAKGFGKIFNEMYRAAICSENYDDAEERATLLFHYERIEQLFIDLSELDGYNDILPEER